MKTVLKLGERLQTQQNRIVRLEREIKKLKTEVRQLRWLDSTKEPAND